MHRFWPEYIYLKKLIDNKTYGRLYQESLKGSAQNLCGHGNSGCMTVKKSGSAALDLHIHDVDFVRYILGEPGIIRSIATTVESVMSIFSVCINTRIVKYHLKADGTILPECHSRWSTG